jgi:hypothetical protein
LAESEGGRGNKIGTSAAVKPLAKPKEPRLLDRNSD